MGSLGAIANITKGDGIQERIDAKNDEIRRRGVKIDVMSDEEWNRREEISKNKMLAKQKQDREEREWMQKEYARQELEKRIKEECQTRIATDSKFPAEIEKLLYTFHEAPEGDNTPESEWKTVYKQVSGFLAKCVIAFRYGNDKASGKLDEARGHLLGLDLADYLARRDIPVDGDESGFNNLVSQKVCHVKRRKRKESSFC